MASTWDLSGANALPNLGDEGTYPCTGALSASATFSFHRLSTLPLAQTRSLPVTYVLPASLKTSSTKKYHFLQFPNPEHTDWAAIGHICTIRGARFLTSQQKVVVEELPRR